MITNSTKVLVLCALTLCLFNCSSDDDDGDRGNWQQRSVFDGVPRSNVVGFVIDNLGYMGTGYDGDDYLNDFWQYNIDGDYWVQKADFPGTERSSASGFAIDGKGYLGIGYNGTDELKDFWEYNVLSNVWTQKADFLGGVRQAAIGFSGNSTGYIGTGYDGDNDRKDFYKYNPSTDSWSELVGFGGEKRRFGTSFNIGNKVYIGTGVSNGLYKTDFWEFDPSTEVFTSKNDLDEDDDYSVARSNAVGFSVGGLGYIVTGYNGGVLESTWEYNSGTDTWEEITGIEAYSRQDALGFSNDTRAFVLLGRSGSLYLDDNYELYPQEEYDDED
ncbi:galactose oxidase [Formosa sp. PL04]|uniref:Kelch repeat-containing protein n=1 Tax=Formosa sp. PL04 TaxID=3081755 RepID=UPI002981EB62|nr:galactose oxidase [Formosa sp. PL04]MDW5288688.1 galactose oxidase [Formosa sp. PL04]